MGDLVRQTLTAGGRLVVGRGKFFRLVKCTAPVDVKIVFPNEAKRVTQIEAGYAFGPLTDREYQQVTVTSATAQDVEVFNGEDAEAYDRTVLLTQLSPPTVFNAGQFAIGAGAEVAIAAIANRARYTVQVDPDAAAAARVRITSASGAATGPILVPGASFVVQNTAAFWIRNVSAVACNVGVVAESYS